jgi:hypothetical protein
MSASTWTNRSGGRAESPETAPQPADPDPGGWIGVDFSHSGTRRPSRALLPLLILALVVALGVASLRIDLIRTRYALATAMAEEQKLIAEQHTLIVQTRKLRDPVGLAVLARERGFRPAESIRSIADPMPMTYAAVPNVASDALPHVGAGPTGFAAASKTEGPTGEDPP